jgi:GWxTD domain-containing protein
VAFLLLAVPGSRAFAARSDVPTPSTGNVAFTADVGSSLAPAGRVMAHVHLEIPYASLRFLREEGEWAASFDVTVVVYEKGKEQLTGDLWTVPLRSTVDPAAAEGPETVFRRSFDLPVVPGRLRFDIRVTQHDSGREGAWSYTLDVPDYGHRDLVVSDFVFGVCRDSAALTSGSGDPGFEPWPRRRYGNDVPDLCVIGQIVDQIESPDTTYRLTYTGQNATGRTEETWTGVVPRRNGRGDLRLRPSISDLTLGTYNLKVEVQLGREKARRERSFEIDETRVNILEDARMLRMVLGYVARNDEILKLEDLPTDSLQSFWDSFWALRDPTPGTERNERLTEFLRRLEYVNSHFSILEPGWSSDMGRIYIRYGGPDEVDRTPYSGAGPPREVWYYFEKGLRFIFYDTEGFGRFRLASNGRQF